MPISPKRASENLWDIMLSCGYVSVSELGFDMGIEPMVLTNILHGKEELTLDQARALDKACKENIRRIFPNDYRSRERKLVILGYF